MRLPFSGDKALDADGGEAGYLGGGDFHAAEVSNDFGDSARGYALELHGGDGGFAGRGRCGCRSVGVARPVEAALDDLREAVGDAVLEKEIDGLVVECKVLVLGHGWCCFWFAPSVFSFD